MTGIQWSSEKSTFIMSISDPYHSGWYDVMIEIEGDQQDALKGAQNVLKDAGYYRPHDNWEWHEEEITYMKKVSTWHQTKVRRKGDTEEEEE